ncbi:MAG: hypothetical protein WCR52_07625 [Bacteroidota bacterium]
MTILLKIKKDIRSQAELQRRKAELKAQMDREFVEIQETMKLVREDLKPINVVKAALNSFLGRDNHQANANTDMISEEIGKRIGRFQGPIRIVTNVLVRDPKIAFMLKTVGPIILAMGPKLAEKAGDALPRRSEVYGNLRQRIAGLRKRLRRTKTKNLPAATPEINDVSEMDDFSEINDMPIY